MLLRNHFFNGKPKIRKIPYEQAVKDYYALIERKKDLINKYTDYLKNYIPIEDREIIETYSKTCLGDGEGILIDGLEEGRFWLKEEYETGYVEVPVGIDGLGKKKIKVK